MDIAVISAGGSLAGCDRRCLKGVGVDIAASDLTGKLCREKVCESAASALSHDPVFYIAGSGKIRNRVDHLADRLRERIVLSLGFVLVNMEILGPSGHLGLAVKSIALDRDRY